MNFTFVFKIPKHLHELLKQPIQDGDMHIVQNILPVPDGEAAKSSQGRVAVRQWGMRVKSLLM